LTKDDATTDPAEEPTSAATEGPVTGGEAPSPETKWTPPDWSKDPIIVTNR
jgi:hypothetical protein